MLNLEEKIEAQEIEQLVQGDPAKLVMEIRAWSAYEWKPHSSLNHAPSLGQLSVKNQIICHDIKNFKSMWSILDS